MVSILKSLKKVTVELVNVNILFNFFNFKKQKAFSRVKKKKALKQDVIFKKLALL